MLLLLDRFCWKYRAAELLHHAHAQFAVQSRRHTDQLAVKDAVATCSISCWGSPDPGLNSSTQAHLLQQRAGAPQPCRAFIM
jgi:hypothetical protein